jgi:site-specific DNA-adenine methylase
MFSYYGSKSKLVNYYPKPTKDLIIEPFAGSARYSLKYWDKDVIINEKYKVVFDVWKWLQKCSENDILKLPTPKPKEDIRNYRLSEEELNFMGFIINRGSASPKNKVGKFSDGLPNTLKRVASNLKKIRHWEVRYGCYTDLDNKQATWFIDPPYQFGGKYYTENEINFKDLSKWCKNRNGEIIVCENTKADWIELQPLKKIQGSNNTNTTEAVFLKGWEKNIFTDVKQKTLFETES